ncbi:type II toxin-antitoxin system VapC family toxin [Rhodopila sp.]|uniref:type II toxin-antitoxin system VapC family toxin n=1 Tax=Rhodopila sp. TaxID=2480087 RepID=UPI003D0E0C7F
MLDSSAALAWLLPGEANPSTEALLTAVGDLGAVAPELWLLETANVLLLAERRGRITLAEQTQGLAILAELPIRIDNRTSALAYGATSALAAASDLTVYDACYLELALRLGLPLASLDQRLCQAASAVGVPLIVTS